MPMGSSGSIAQIALKRNSSIARGGKDGSRRLTSSFHSADKRSFDCEWRERKRERKREDERERE